jgi:hypothetical protein
MVEVVVVQEICILLVVEVVLVLQEKVQQIITLVVVEMVE